MFTTHPKTEEIVQPYVGRTHLGQLLDNEKGEIDLEIAEKLVKGKPEDVIAGHYTRDKWHGFVFYRDGRFYDQIRLLGDTIGLYSADTLEELMVEVNKIHAEKK